MNTSEIGNGEKARREEWRGSIAVGSRPFVEKLKALLGFRTKGREVIVGGEGYQVREGPALYNAVFRAEKDDIDPENTHLWDIKTE